jgi:Heterokaryon incompatibility protein (HET)
MNHHTLGRQQLGVLHSTERESYAHRNIHLFKFPCASSFTMSQYCYSPLSLGANNIRLLRLMPHANESIERTKLQCELFEYSLQDLGKRTHLYEALSYTWGGEERPCSIAIKEQNLDVTRNLYAALLRLQDRLHQPMYSMLEYIRTDSAVWSYPLALLYSIAVSWIEFWPLRAQGWQDSIVNFGRASVLNSQRCYATARLAILSFNCNIWCYAVSSQSIKARAAVNMATSQVGQPKRVLSLGK